VASAQSRVELIVDASRAINPLRKTEQATRKLEGAVRDANGRLRDSKGRFIGAGQSARRAGRDFDQFGSAVKRAAAAYVTFTAAQSAVSAGIQRIESERRIQFLARSYGEVADLAGAATAASKRFGQSQTEANRALADVYARLRPVGVSLDDIVSTYNGFNTAARISGATSVEASNAFRQLAQALGSGALRGDEFNSISEQVPGILTAISQETGVAQGKLRAYAAEGEITADIVIRALRRIEKDGAGQLEEALAGPQQAIVDFQNSIEDLQVAATTDLIPSITAAFRGLKDLLESLGPVIKELGSIAAQSLGTVADLVNAITKPKAAAAATAIKGGRLPLAGLGGISGAEELFKGTITPFGTGLAGIKEEAKVIAEGSGRQVTQVLVETMQKYLSALEQARGLALAFGRGEGGLRTLTPGMPLGPDKKKEKKGAKSPLEIQREQLASILQAERDRASLASALNAEEERAFQLNIDLANIKRQFPDLSNQELQPLIEATIQTYERVEASEALKKSNKDRADAEAKALKEQQQEAQRLEQIYGQLGQTIATGVTDMLMAAVDGTKSLAEVASNMLKNLTNQLLQLAVNTALFSLFPGSSLFKGLPRFANGGSISGGKPAIVGERGPELFMPGRSGSIVPNSALGGANVTVNVDASGSNVQGNQPDAAALGRAIGAAVQAELVKQKRPGGLLA
jgi:tape measure domain-containing protein